MTVPLVSAENLPRYGTFWSLQRSNSAPLPFFAPYLREADSPVYLLDAQQRVFLVDDLAFDYVALYQEREEQRQLRRAAWELGLISDEEYWANEGGSPGPIAASYGPEDLWLEITGVTNNYAYLTLHGTVDTDFYQLLSKTNLASTSEWTSGALRLGEFNTNQTDFLPVDVGDNTNMFFRAQRAQQYVVLGNGPSAYEPTPLYPSGADGSFILSASIGTQDLTVHYRVSGTTSNGADYTSLTGVVTIPAGSSSSNITVHPLTDNVVEGSEILTLTLVQTNGYLIHPDHPSATITVNDFSIRMHVWSLDHAIEPNGPPGVIAHDGSFWVHRTDDLNEYPAMTVLYDLSGTASNGVDYEVLSGTVSFAAMEYDKYLAVTPRDDALVEALETVTLTLVPTNTYLIDTNDASATVNIVDTTTTVSVLFQQNAIEPNPNSNTPKQTGKFTINRADTRNELPALTVSYQLGGTATQGDDYTNLTGMATVPAGIAFADVFIEPLFDGQFEGDETVTLTLTRIGDGYNISPGFASATLFVVDNVPTNTFQKVATLNGIVGIDYHSPSNRIIASVAFRASGEPTNFVCVYTNMVSSNLVTVITNWSRVHGAPDEVKLVTVKRTTTGFTNGEVFFGSDRAIGWISADGSVSNMTWCVLTNAVQMNALHLRGSLCWDETGAFSNSVIAVTSDGGPAPNTKKGVWRVDANRVPTLLANLDTSHLEGVIVLTNDASQWGPWAGNIITGDEEASPPLIYTIDAIGLVTTNDTTQWYPSGIHTEDFDLIPTNQDLYISDLSGNKLMKVSYYAFTNFVGQLLITDGGDYGGVHHPASFFAARWDAAATNFVTTKLLSYTGDVEHVTFAPINLPTQNP